MDKEKLNKILPYCGYRLKCLVPQIPNQYAEMIHGVSFYSQHHVDEEHISKILNGKYKPILFSPDCLTKEIETEYGKEVPLIEMAKIACPGEYYKWEIKNNYAVSGIVSVYMNDDGSISIDRTISSDGYTSPDEVQNQWELFQYLYSRHIAFNLHPNEYVSVESLEKNPYADINSGI